MSEERKRLIENEKRQRHWKKWGPYVSERQWGTVREDYSEDGEAWDYFNFFDSHARAYRWGEDGIAGFCDNHQNLCFAFSFWNEEDAFLKEKMFGLSNRQGNHGEDVKELYYYLDATPTHSYMKFLYKYPQTKFPYDELLEVNEKRSQKEREFELLDTKIFDENKYFDIFIEYAKADVDDLYVYITAHNRGQEARTLHLLPTLWYRNTWVWKKGSYKPEIKLGKDKESITSHHEKFGDFTLYAEKADEVLFTENESNLKELFEVENQSPFVKDAFHQYVVHKNTKAVNPKKTGTKAAFYYKRKIEAKGSTRIVLRLANQSNDAKPLALEKKIYDTRLLEANAFYKEVIPESLSDDLKSVQRQALAGMIWSRQFYHYVIHDWAHGDMNDSSQKLFRKNPRNLDWVHLYSDDILSMPDKWEYPWFAAWDLAFHSVVFSLIDPEFAKRQLTLLTREWFMHPNGQLPAYEWNFDDINPPVHAWAAWRVFKMEGKRTGVEDRHFLEEVFQKLLMNFTWWVNREDATGRNIFRGGFLGLDNISIFNRSQDLPPGGVLYQSDATSWMGMFCLNMLTISLDLARQNPAYEDMASKFFEHFLYIADAINFEHETMHALWDEECGFYYDLLTLPNGEVKKIKVRSLVGLIPLLAVTTIEQEALDKFPDFSKRMHWFLSHRKGLCAKVAPMKIPGVENRRILSIVHKDKLAKILGYVLDEKEFLSPYGIRSLSLYHKDHPFSLKLNSHSYTVDYEPGESSSRLFGGNSNWRGPIWMPINFLIIESLQKYHHYYGDDFKIECPTGSGVFMNLWEVSLEISRRLIRIYSKDKDGRRAVFDGKEKCQTDPFFKDHMLFHEYFHADTGEGIGASHQTGWTGLMAKLLQQLGEHTGVVY